jgi:hypothetical protein
MGLDEIRDASRALVHEQFSLPAVATSPDGSVEVPGLRVRMHRDLKKAFGDLDREGFAMVIEEYNQLIFDREEWEPVRGYVIDFGRERKFEMDHALDDKGQRYVRWQVVFKP